MEYLSVSAMCVSFLSQRAAACNATHAIATRKPSVCLSVRQTRGLWQNEIKYCPHSYTAWKIMYPTFLTRNGCWGDPFYLKFWAKWPRWSENADFQWIFPRSAAAVTPSEKVQLTLIGSPLRVFQW